MRPGSHSINENPAGASRGMAMSRTSFNFGSSLRSSRMVACTRIRTRPCSKSTRLPRPLFAMVRSEVSTRISPLRVPSSAQVWMNAYR